PGGARVGVADLLTRQPDDRRVDDRGHLLDVIEEQPVEQHFVGILERPKIDMALEGVALVLVGFVRAHCLLSERLDMRRGYYFQAERSSFRIRERRALVQALAVEKIHTTWQLSVSCHDRPPVSAAMSVVERRCSTSGSCERLLPQPSSSAPGMLRRF